MTNPHDAAKDNNPPTLLLCATCGKPIARGLHCVECIDRGLGPCTACEGASLLDIEEEGP
jgi:hypothetical protein